MVAVAAAGGIHGGRYGARNFGMSSANGGGVVRVGGGSSTAAAAAVSHTIHHHGRPNLPTNLRQVAIRTTFVL